MRDKNPIVFQGALGRGDQFLETTTVLPMPIDEVYAFFANAGNLERITPPELRFRILTPMPVEVCEGALIDYRLRLFGVPFHWRTRIAVWQPNREFVDEQLCGPYRQWRHRHTFEACEAGTRMTDRVEYRLPLWPAGAVALPLVRGQLGRIFRYRASAIRKILSGESLPR